LRLGEGAKLDGIGGKFVNGQPHEFGRLGVQVNLRTVDHDRWALSENLLPSARPLRYS
jgi:hypothetical protein